MGSIERAIDQISLFGAGNDQFDVCNRKNNNPTSQEDIIPVNKDTYILRVFHQRFKLLVRDKVQNYLWWSVMIEEYFLLK